jgi:outer membrane protein OmpA-like peptidoglycan-associated protein
MEQTLAKRDTVVIYGIYFDFARSDIRRESAPVLREIAHVMQRNAGWTLAVNGYTDSIGGHQYNLALSKRRAAAVKDSLVSAYHIAPSRLETAGYGDTFPVDSNSTLAGRARNRRVELIRR